MRLRRLREKMRIKFVCGCTLQAGRGWMALLCAAAAREGSGPRLPGGAVRLWGADRYPRVVLLGAGSGLPPLGDHRAPAPPHKLRGRTRSRGLGGTWVGWKLRLVVWLGSWVAVLWGRSMWGVGER